MTDGDIQFTEAQLAYHREAEKLMAWADLAERTGSGHAYNRLKTQEDLVETLWMHLSTLQETRDYYDRYTSVEEYVAAELAAAEPVASSGKLGYAAIKERVDIVEHIGRFTELRKVGKNLIGRCPLPGHDDSSPSFYVYPETKSFYCFGCAIGGDVITFAQYHSGTKARDL